MGFWGDNVGGGGLWWNGEHQIGRHGGGHPSRPTGPLCPESEPKHEKKMLGGFLKKTKNMLFRVLKKVVFKTQI